MPNPEIDAVMAAMTEAMTKQITGLLQTADRRFEAIGAEISKLREAAANSTGPGRSSAPIGTAQARPPVQPNRQRLKDAIASLRPEDYGDTKERFVLRVPSDLNDIAKALPVHFDEKKNQKYIARSDYDDLGPAEKTVVDSWRPVNQWEIRVPKDQREQMADYEAKVDHSCGKEFICKDDISYDDIPNDWKKENQVERRVPFYETETAEGMGLTYSKADCRSFVPNSMVQTYSDAQKAAFDRYDEGNQTEIHVPYHDFVEHFEDDESMKYGFDRKYKTVYYVDSLPAEERGKFERWDKSPKILRVPYADSKPGVDEEGNRLSSKAEENGVSYDYRTGESWIHQHDITAENSVAIHNWMATNQVDLRIPYEHRFEEVDGKRVDRMESHGLGWDEKNGVSFLTADRIANADKEFLKKYTAHNQHVLDVPKSSKGGFEKARELGAHYDKVKKVLYLTGDDDPARYDHLVRKKSRVNTMHVEKTGASHSHGSRQLDPRSQGGHEMQ